mgnify:CR=1 FL=1
MNRLKASRVVVFSLLVLFFSLLTNMAAATAETFSVPAGQSAVRIVDLNAEDEVSGRITVVGKEESKDINFTVTDPNGHVVLPTESVVVANFKFSASEKGTYHLVFDNSGSVVDKTVAINYEVRHYWFGLPQEFVLMLIVVFIGVFGLVIYAMMKR